MNFFRMNNGCRELNQFVIGSRCNRTSFFCFKSKKGVLLVSSQNKALFQVHNYILCWRHGCVRWKRQMFVRLFLWDCFCEIVLQLNFEQIGVRLQIDLNSKYVSIDNFANGLFFIPRKMTKCLMTSLTDTSLHQTNIG